MVTIFTYTIAVSVPLLILWVAYRIFLACEKRFAANRSILMLSYIASLILPPTLKIFERSTTDIEPTITLTTSAIGLDYDNLATIFSIINRLSAVWLAGAAIVAILTVAEMLRIVLIISRSRKTKENGTSIRVTSDRRISPFSIGNIIVMNQDDYINHRKIILRHENGHVSYRHTFDLIIAQSATILCWYNPAAWLMKSELKKVHEYQADSYTLSDGTDARTYQLFLINKAAGTRLPRIANSFNRNDLESRIAMMQRKRCKGISANLRYIAPLAALLAGAIVLHSPAIRAAVNAQSALPPAATINTNTIHRHDDPDVFVDGRLIEFNQLNTIPANNIRSITINKERNSIEINTR